MSGKWGRMFAGVMIALPLGACITMQKKEDGKPTSPFQIRLQDCSRVRKQIRVVVSPPALPCRMGDKLRRQRQEGLPPGKHRQMATIPGKSRCSIPVGLMPP